MVLRCFHSASFRVRMSGFEWCMVGMLIPAWLAYSLYINFSLLAGQLTSSGSQSHGFQLSDYLRLNRKSAFGNDWLPVVQMLVVTGWVGLSAALVLLFSGSLGIPLPLRSNHESTRHKLLSAVCLLSAAAMVTSVMIFRPGGDCFPLIANPWSSPLCNLGFFAFLLDLAAGLGSLISMRNVDHKNRQEDPRLKCGQL